MTKTFDELKDQHLSEIGMTLGELEQKIVETLALLAQIKASHKAYARTYLPEARAVAYAQGLVHGPEDAKALDAILTTAEEHPEYLKSLAAKDGGSDDAAFEVPLLYARLEAVKRVQEAGEKALSLANLLLDTAASIGENAKPITQAAYRILKPISANDPQLETTLAPAITYHKSKASSRAKKQ